MILVLRCPGPHAQTVDEMMTKMEADKDARLEADMRRVMDMDSSPGLEPGEYLPSGLKKAGRVESKQIAVKRARAFISEVLAALASDSATAELEIARAKGMNMFAEQISKPVEALDYDEEILAPSSRDGSDEMLRAVGPIIDRLTKDIILKYEFEGGFEQAMASVADAQRRKGDKEIEIALQRISHMLAPAGRVPHVHVLAVKFLASGAAERNAAIKQVEHLFTSATDGDIRANIGEYLATMRGIVEKGASYVRDAIVGLVRSAREQESDGTKLTLEERSNFDMRVETLLEFLSAADQKELEEDLAESEATEL